MNHWKAMLEQDFLTGIMLQRGNGTPREDTFGYNPRSELTSATLGADNYTYAFDNIGNRTSATEAATVNTYTTNALNQYDSILRGEATFQSLQYDADGNATLVRTSTGTWAIEYNGANRPIRFRNEETDTIVDCGYDSQGRRYFKKVTVAGTVELHHRYIYRGYLQIAALDLKRSAHPALWLVTWDPSQPTATRPLALQKDGTWFTYGYDITKNICEVFGQHGYIRTAYSYAPFGSVSASGDVTQPFQWSSEHYDSELDLVYYNYRHYSPTLGRFLSRDPIAEQGGRNLYAFVKNNPNVFFDELGGSVAIAVGGGIGIGIGTGILVGIGIAVGIGVVVGVVAIGVISIIDSIPTSDAQVEEESDEKTDAVPIEKCEPCMPKRRCSDDVYSRLKKAVDNAKDVVGKFGKCKKTDSCSMLQEKIFAWQNEIVARENMMNQCFDGGDESHRTQLSNVCRQEDNCLVIFTTQCGH